jgi:hypothetical protein
LRPGNLKLYRIKKLAELAGFIVGHLRALRRVALPAMRTHGPFLKERGDCVDPG